MQNLSEKIGSIELKVRQLALLLERLQNENANLVDENKQLKDNLLDKNNRISELENGLANTKQVLERKRENDPESSRKLRKDIEQYIKEVDKCIEWLQNN